MKKSLVFAVGVVALVAVPAAAQADRTPTPEPQCQSVKTTSIINGKKVVTITTVCPSPTIPVPPTRG